MPIDIDRAPAREAARAELSDPAYAAAEPSALGRALRWLAERLTELFGVVSGAFASGPLGLVILLVAVAVLVVAIRLRVGRTVRGRPTPGAVFGETRRTAEQYRGAAAEEFAAGSAADAVRDAFRGLVRGLEERELLDERSSRTADEAATDAGAALPEYAERLRQAARRFDEVHYGALAATAEDYRLIAELDSRIHGARPVPAP